jgi:hypothetical protein
MTGQATWLTLAPTLFFLLAMGGYWMLTSRLLHKH